ncbi:uncharacterized protein F5Z01DRAFT_331881 [Emericellopsis atlantica]|uniref:Rhodopsin domain-containing protein n=1 Tax=Emericellopsis atlantica TaxID=2614577 RepID=A0A9P7ZG78_9HYPO|nr:uncharacterized protein F5Z01DRAFT_331881 [Emericellopsis atlantica]KAG9251087.1 hypothetical protein F5Z01DRAFT_331881 [Emericellopsis atlantica]
MDAMLSSRSEEGERIAKISHSLPTIKPEGFTIVIQAVSYTLCILSTVIVALRIYVRIKLSGPERAWGWDDLSAVAGWLPFCPSVVFLIMATYYGLGASDSQVPDGQLKYYQVICKEYMFYFEMIYFGSSVLTKLSMAIMIVRLSSTTFFTRIIWGNMVVLGINAAVCLIIMFVSCSPIPAMWNPDLGFCRIEHGWIIISYAGTVVLAMVDWTCAITPFFILEGLQMPTRRKRSVQAILGLGIFGSAAGLVRLGYYHTYDTVKYPNNSLHNFGHTILWSVLEAGLGIMACSLPPLRKLFNKQLGSTGASGGKSGLSTNEGGTQLSNIGGMPKGGGIANLRRTDTSQWDRLDDEHSTSSQQYIIKSTHITVETQHSDGDAPSVSEGGKKDSRHWKNDT